MKAREKKIEIKILRHESIYLLETDAAIFGIA